MSSLDCIGTRSSTGDSVTILYSFFLIFTTYSQQITAQPFLRALQRGDINWYQFWQIMGRRPTAEECRQYGLNDPASPPFVPTEDDQDPMVQDLPLIEVRFATFAEILASFSYPSAAASNSKDSKDPNCPNRARDKGSLPSLFGQSPCPRSLAPGRGKTWLCLL